MTDTECVEVLKALGGHMPLPYSKQQVRAAIERAVELLEREAPRMMTSIWPSKAGGDTVAHRDKP